MCCVKRICRVTDVHAAVFCGFSDLCLLSSDTAYTRQMLHEICKVNGFEWQLQTSNMRRIFVGHKTVDHSEVVGASPVDVAPTISSFSTKQLASMDWGETTARRDALKCRYSMWLILKVWWYLEYGDTLPYYQYIDCLPLRFPKWTFRHNLP